MRIRSTAPALAAGALLLSGCVGPGPMNVPLKFDAGAAPEPVSDEHRPVKRGPACAVFLAEVRDVREDKTGLGNLGSIRVEGQDTEGWVAAAIKASAADPGVSFVETPPAGAAGLTLSATLVKVYLSTQNMAKTATVVLRIRYRRGDSDLGEVFYRGNSGGVYWGVGKGEMVDALNGALRDALAPLPRDISARCQAGAATTGS